METDEQYMEQAIREAQKAALAGEVPVGAVIVRDDGEILSRAYNRREEKQSALAHAEMLAIAEACEKTGFWRLAGCTLYVTLEPCPMCAGAVMNARIDRVVFGAYDPKAGACGTMFDLFAFPVNHRPRMTGGVLQEQCAALLTLFFQNLRMERK